MWVIDKGWNMGGNWLRQRGDWHRGRKWLQPIPSSWGRKGGQEGRNVCGHPDAVD